MNINNNIHINNSNIMSIHKNKGSRQLLDNDSGIFIQPVVYAVINSIKRGREVCIDVQIYDIQKAFDSL